ncbi:hypothetical protein E2C01_060460 [Portunus trituberculatus]|uniref:Secreted protein n=1 Tax=Portunus trituberculatus TaxID=210409 RepID=A0A5B7HC59_PORTR|nr:hypothetical protein [Portunus trituberculatus]
MSAFAWASVAASFWSGSRTWCGNEGSTPPSHSIFDNLGSALAVGGMTGTDGGMGRRAELFPWSTAFSSMDATSSDFCPDSGKKAVGPNSTMANPYAVLRECAG